MGSVLRTAMCSPCLAHALSCCCSCVPRSRSCVGQPPLVPPDASPITCACLGPLAACAAPSMHGWPLACPRNGCCDLHMASPLASQALLERARMNSAPSTPNGAPGPRPPTPPPPVGDLFRCSCPCESGAQAAVTCCVCVPGSVGAECLDPGHHAWGEFCCRSCLLGCHGLCNSPTQFRRQGLNRLGHLQQSGGCEAPASEARASPACTSVWKPGQVLGSPPTPCSSPRTSACFSCSTATPSMPQPTLVDGLGV